MQNRQIYILNIFVYSLFSLYFETEFIILKQVFLYKYVQKREFQYLPLKKSLYYILFIYKPLY